MTGYHIMTDEEIDNEDDVDKETKTFLHTAMLFMLWT
jgi:hypothetical protein